MTPDDKPKPPDPNKPEPPDGRGERPTDPIEFAKWLVEQTADNDADTDRNSRDD